MATRLALLNESRFSAWLRGNAGLDSQTYGLDCEDVDLLFCDPTKERKIYFREYKGKKSVLTAAQKDTHGILDWSLAYFLPKFSSLSYGGYQVIEGQNPTLDCSNFLQWEDNSLLLWHAYRDGNIVVLSRDFKPYVPSFNLRRIVLEAMRHACSDLSFQRVYESRPQRITFCGLHSIGDDGRQFFLDGRKVTNSQLTRFLRFADVKS